jgi:hypothetical protein
MKERQRAESVLKLHQGILPGGTRIGFDLFSFVEAIHKGLSTEDIDILVRGCISEGYEKQALEVAKMGASKETIEFLIDSFTKAGPMWKAQAREARELLQTKPAPT